MDEFAIGDTVQITGARMTGSVGTVVFLDHDRRLYLVRVGAAAQDFFSSAEIERFAP